MHSAVIYYYKYLNKLAYAIRKRYIYCNMEGNLFSYSSLWNNLLEKNADVVII
jgi:hypothetical protein